MAMFRVTRIIFLILALWNPCTSSPSDRTRLSKADIYEQDNPSTWLKRGLCSGNVTILDQTDVANSPIASCTSFAGDIILDNARGNISFLTEAAEGLQVLDGSIYCRNNVGLQQLFLTGLTNTGSIVVDTAYDLVLLSAIDLVGVQSIQITNSPQFLTLALGGVKQLESLEIAGTSMTYEDMADAPSPIESIGSLYIHDNVNLTIGALAFSRLQNITTSLVFENNGPNSQILLDILWVNNITLRNVQGVNFQRMVAVNHSFEISGSENITGVDFETLESIGGSLYIQNNPKIQTVFINSLKTIGESLVIADNAALLKPSAEALQSVGNIDLTGPFQSLSSLNGSFDSLSKVSQGISVLFTNQTPPIECFWSASDKGPAFGGAWSSFLTCNGSGRGAHTSDAISTKLRPGGGIIASIYLAVACWWLLCWAFKL